MLSSAATAMWLLAELPAKAADPAAMDCVTASNNSVELGNEHRLRAARAQLLVCAASSCPSDVRKECMRRVDAINAQIPTIIFEAKDADGRDLSAVKVTMDGQPFADRLEGTALPLDPGEHTFVFETASRPSVVRHLVVREAQKERRETLTFGATAPPAPPRYVPPEPHGGLGAQKTLAIVTAGIGVAGLGVGSVFGLMMLSKKSDAQKACPDVCADQGGVDLWNDAVSSGNLATAFLVGGGIAIAGAAVLWFAAPSSGAPAARVGFGPGTLEVKGSW
jgi:hypothetical protein